MSKIDSGSCSQDANPSLSPSPLPLQSRTPVHPIFRDFRFTIHMHQTVTPVHWASIQTDEGNKIHPLRMWQVGLGSRVASTSGSRVGPPSAAL